MRLKNKNIIISGGSQGFGYEVAKLFIREGANIMICARNAELLQKAERNLASLSKNSRVCAEVVDVSEIAQVDYLMERALLEFGRIDGLVANAGVYGTKGALDEVDWEEWSKAIDINLKGTVLQCRAVLPHFKKNKYGKIIILSGGGATKPLPFLSAYAASKAGVVRFSETLALETAEYNIDVNTVAPGALNTRLLEEILMAGPEKVGIPFYKAALNQKQSGGTSLAVGAALCTFLASHASDGISGRLISAVWDPWERLPMVLEDLKQSDIYTLRRIVPEDRGKSWRE